MTWLKISDEFAVECARAELSDAAFRLHVEALSWVMHRESGGFISRREVDRASEVDDTATAVKELVAAGFWQAEPPGYRITHHMEHQPEPDLLARRRVMSADRQRRWRRRQAGLDDRK